MRIFVLAALVLLLSPPVQAGPLRCAEDSDGAACVWGKVEGFDGDSVQIRGLRVALAGLAAPARKDLCASKSAKDEFDCARLARKRLGELAAKGLACEVLEVSSSTLWGRCRNAEGDVGRQMVSSGVARAAKDGPYAEAQKQAVLSKRGLWAPDLVLPRDWESVRRKAVEDED